MTDTLGAAKGERTTGRNGYRSGCSPSAQVGQKRVIEEETILTSS